ncbi:hypothetical protein [Allofournierella sp.]|uniref:hypothetical protein n=1 Tax=Allofournierella sp. TaxID=1940256 RepID=UPI003AB60680
MILYLCNGSGDMIHCKHIEKEAIIDTKWKHKDRARRKLEQKLFLCGEKFSRFALGAWSKSVQQYDVIIIEALIANIPLIQYVKKHACSGTRIILWHWNKIFKNSILPEDPICSGCELWSFDPDDCKQYGMKFNTQYFDSAWVTYRPAPLKRDVWFIGGDKNRATYLQELARTFAKLGLKSEIHIVADKTSDFRNGVIYKKNLCYKQALYELQCSKAALDISRNGQTGLTLRPMEAMFLEKKLITNNQKIMECPFYSPKNVFVIGVDEWKMLPKLLEEPFDRSIRAELDYYEVANWINRFGEDNV